METQRILHLRDSHFEIPILLTFITHRTPSDWLVKRMQSRSKSHEQNKCPKTKINVEWKENAYFPMTFVKIHFVFLHHHHLAL